ncbi:interleukin-27 subunit beta [Sardina pilchardus]|uniref:interleukin-27 subunit beta n=1 Tax=Sardina pilchardus TaxID=27697 RepID=UPI002E1075C9
MYRWCYVGACIAFITFSTGHCQDLSTQLLNDRPMKDVYVEVGSEVKVLCEGVAGGEPVEWTLNGSQVASSALFHLNSTRLEDRGVYTCHSLSRGAAIQQVHLKPGYPPSPPDIRCWAPSYPMKALCTWSQITETYIPTQHIITYEDRDYGVIYPCHIIPQSPDSLCEMKNLQVLASRPYIVYITASNALGNATKSMVFDLEENVKPDPPVNVRAVKRGRKVVVDWNPPPSWPQPQHFPLMYKVRYYWGNNQERGHIIEVDVHDTKSVSLDRLVEGRTYHFQVSAHEELGSGTGSEWSPPVGITVR